MPRITDYRKTDKLFNLNCFREVMSRNRYMLIMRVLHFSRNPERGAGVSKPSRLYKIDTVVEYFNNRMLELYQPSKQLSLDESMVLWRGRLIFRQYIKNKRHKYGIKLYMLTAPNRLVLDILIFSGQGTDSTPEQSHTEHVVYRLMENHLDKGH
ncbi:piggyBac transposable element-derived protein 4-like [Acyrthosiphon pisum]|uniref:PiggyBac transposable element-derived protein domain-containing protein n=1 Tax=Acyrthosiphon pisum TaxID=7029 RepID=A0A8R2JWS6_ACYPI|nr:piggyBac transposable element-derived protein 4-like [Acyrthosiphon pisum]